MMYGLLTGNMPLIEVEYRKSDKKSDNRDKQNPAGRTSIGCLERDKHFRFDMSLVI